MLRYPIYVISKSRSDCCLTANFLIKDNVPFHIVIEPQQEQDYLKYYDKKYLYILPFSDLGLGGIPARNWVWEDSLKKGFKRHWILDDNIRCAYRRFNQKRLYCDSKYAFQVLEDFVERYENIALAGIGDKKFYSDRGKYPPFYLNVHVYSWFLILNELPYRWRGRYNEDTDLCLQVFANNWCTVLMNAFLMDKIHTMKMKGGNTDELYKGDGRLKMARALERVWPGVVTTKRRFQRPQHVIKDSWRKFDTPLIRRKDIDWKNLPKINEYGMQLKQLQPIQSENIKRIFNNHQALVRPKV